MECELKENDQLGFTIFNLLISKPPNEIPGAVRASRILNPEQNKQAKVIQTETIKLPQKPLMK